MESYLSVGIYSQSTQEAPIREKYVVKKVSLHSLLMKKFMVINPKKKERKMTLRLFSLQAAASILFSWGIADFNQVDRCQLDLRGVQLEVGIRLVSRIR